MFRYALILHLFKYTSQILNVDIKRATEKNKRLSGWFTGQRCTHGRLPRYTSDPSISNLKGNSFFTPENPRYHVALHKKNLYSSGKSMHAQNNSIKQSWWTPHQVKGDVACPSPLGNNWSRYAAELTWMLHTSGCWDKFGSFHVVYLFIRILRKFTINKIPDNVNPRELRQDLYYFQSLCCKKVQNS